MTVIEHGDWQRYQPSTLPEGAPGNALFSRRAGDGADWYDYANAGANFRGDTVKMTVIDNIVAAAVTDPTMLFPAYALVLEVTDVPLDDLQNMWGGKIYDPATKTFSDPPPPTEMLSVTALLDRIAALEAKLGGA